MTLRFSAALASLRWVEFPENAVSQSVARKLGAKAERETVFAELVHTVFAALKRGGGTQGISN